MQSSKCTILQKLELNDSELGALPAVQGSLRREQTLQSLGPFFTNFDAGNRLRVKLRHEARSRKLAREAKALPSFEEIEAFKTALLKKVRPPNVDDVEMIYYDDYKLLCDWDLYGRIPVNCIINYILKRREKTKFLIALHWYDSSYQGYLVEQDLKEYLTEQMLPRIPSLTAIVDSPMADYYFCIAIRKFFFMLDQKKLKKIRVIDIAASGLLEEMLSVCDMDKSQSVNSVDAPVMWFSKENCENIQTAYMELDNDNSGLLNYEELKNFRQMTNFFIRRLFETVQTYDKDQIDLRGFCDLLLAVENKADTASLAFYFRLLDVDDDGYLSGSDLQFFYRDIAALYEETYSSTDQLPPFEDVKDEIFDMCRPKDPARISFRELVDSGKGGTIVGMLTDLNSFLAYECREDVAGEE